MRCPLTRLFLFTLAALALAVGAHASEVVVLRSGQFQGAPGTVPTNPPASLSDDSLTCLVGSGPGAIRAVPFTPADFSAARSGPSALLVVPPGAYQQELDCDRDARWVHSDHSAIVNGLSNYPPRSVLYAIDFQIQTLNDPTGTIQFCWSVDNRLGDTLANPDGVYLNGVPLSSDFRGGDNFFQSAATQTDVPLLTGLNTLYIYQVDNGTGCCAGLNFSCRISVDGPEVIRLRTGQVGGGPGVPSTTLPAFADDTWRFNPITSSILPLSSVPFTAGDFAGAALGPFAETVRPTNAYVSSLECDPDARWINWIHDPFQLPQFPSGSPAASVLYACPFQVDTPGNPLATITACWAADDRLGDPIPDPLAGPNTIGVYVNGQPLSSDFSGGTPGTETTATQADVPLVTGANYLYVYVRDTGSNASGLLFSATITVQCDDQRYESFCFGDGGNGAGCTDCPCNNNAAPGSGGGCLNAANRSARLVASGIAQVSADSLRFELLDAVSFTFAVLVSGANRLPNNPVNPCFGLDSGIPSLAFDGLRCIGGGTTRHGTRPTNGDGDAGVTTAGWGPPNGPAGGLIAFNGFVSGQTRHFQAIYREDLSAVCGTGQNTSQGVTVTVAP